ncbi:MAG: hypothetical protein ACYDHM_10445 [Acidiferrobacterales bacterium]
MKRSLVVLTRWLFAKIAVDGLTLDPGSTVMTRHGNQEGAVRGYHPAPARPVSPHPLMAFVADMRSMIAQCGLHSGNRHTAPGGSCSRRGVGIRQQVQKRETAKGKFLSLFADVPRRRSYRSAALVTDLMLSAVEIWRRYRGRADGENRIKELNYDFAANRFCLNEFWATAVVLNAALLTYNLMSLFCQPVPWANVLQRGGNDVQRTLKILRCTLFAKAGYTTAEDRKDILKPAIALRQRQRREGLRFCSKIFSLPVYFTSIFSPA